MFAGSASPQRGPGKVRLPAARRLRSAPPRTAAWRWASTDRPLLPGGDTIRDAIAFPKTGSGGDMMTGAPAELEPEQQAELYRTLECARSRPASAAADERGARRRIDRACALFAYPCESHLPP